ncbi:MAG TPA: hypothetical protein VFX05_13045 [Casimicrobiaceae bacterium]|nr:hypothetical protein [Casimicrobiaceae bacterium]
MADSDSQRYRVEYVVNDWRDEERQVTQRVACISVPALGLHFAVNLDTNEAHLTHPSAMRVTRDKSDERGSGDTPPNWSRC